MPRYAFGPFSLDTEARVLRQDGGPIPLAGKTLDTLIVLVQNRGRLVDKDELLSRVWAGTVVEEANLTQSISTVRKILGDSPKDHRYIATVAGRGYQFVAQVTESSSTILEAEGSLKERTRPWHGKGVLRFSALAALLAALAGMVFWRLRRPASDHMPEPIPFTSGAGMREHPTFSPDGKQIAYSLWTTPGSEASIYVKLIGSDTDLRITTSSGTDENPVWSPDGRSIAFFRRLPGKSGWYIVSALGGPVRQIFHTRDDNDDSLDWFPDGRHVAVALIADEPSSASSKTTWNLQRIVSLDLETGEQKCLTRPETVKALGDSQPAVSPDGKKVAFVRWRGADDADIYLVDSVGSPTRRLTDTGAIFRGLAWTPDGHELVCAMEQDGRNRLWRMAISEIQRLRLTRA